jgi:pSer/pThr/pTyr-binding forkhead associated (FHA) protein
MENYIHFSLQDLANGRLYSETLQDGDVLIIGRNPENGTKQMRLRGLTNTTVSREHIGVSARDSGLEVMDLDSRNGSRIVRRRPHRKKIQGGFKSGLQAIDLSPYIPVQIKDEDVLLMGYHANGDTRKYLVRINYGNCNYFPISDIKGIPVNDLSKL